jgi:hypothetical protein
MSIWPNEIHGRVREKEGEARAGTSLLTSNGAVELLSCKLYANQRLRAYENMCYLVDKYAPWSGSKDLLEDVND